MRQNSKEGKVLPSPTYPDLIGSFGLTEESEAKNCFGYPYSPSTYGEVSPQILGSFDSSWSLGVTPSPSEKSSFWINTISNMSRRSSCLSSSRPSASSFSSSYTSWAKPIVGHKISDSCVPASSILDQDEQGIESDGRLVDVGEDKEERTGRRMFRMGSKRLRRASSADTSKDIDDIDDFELDVFDECDLPPEDDIVFTVEEDSEERKDKRLSGVMSSPNLAYGSMNGDLEHQEGE